MSLLPEAELIYRPAEHPVGIVPEPQERLAPQQPREIEVFVLERFSYWVDRNEPGGLREVVPARARH